MPMSEAARKAASERMKARHAAARVEPDALDAAVAVAEPPAAPTAQERANRAASRRTGMNRNYLTPLQQIRPLNRDAEMQAETVNGPWAYYLRPDGITISSALIRYPNGGVLPRNEDPRGRYSENAQYYQQRNARKGFIYVGTTLTTEGAHRLVEILARNRPDAVERLKDEIAECEVFQSDIPERRQQMRRRREQLLLVLSRVEQPFNPDNLVAELAEIARAQRMAKVSPETLAVMREMLASQGQAFDAKFAEMVKHFEGKQGQLASAPEGVASLD